MTLKKWSVRPPVALLAEGVDRNGILLVFIVQPLVALLAEGVDRNWKNWTQFITHCTSPSSRRAWIEMVSVVRIW